ncbi:EthD domain-containing protein [Tamaricihabitans halophyticus]|uniref:EthD domain-containing protein n=1 Tax=Tamaricihabitans halophyticus TaxID=1262583 RepID=A0A4R2QCT0_9PSEU|nr:EthD domain-containing protein [Tamaricihabitans halophyticus]TCP46833.1 EthD domain-containing protein [Tamaricihabitans halophyticus]
MAKLTMSYAPGVKLIELVSRNPELPAERFHYHWHAIHGELGRLCSVQANGTINRYCQNHRINPTVDGLAPLDYDGVGEIWFDNEAAVEQLLQSPAYLEKLRPDEPGMADLSSTITLLCRERELLDRGLLPVGTAKITVSISRRAGLDDAEFEARFAAHGEKFRDQPGLIQYTQSRVDAAKAYVHPDGSSPGGQIDAIELIAWPDLLKLESAWGSVGQVYLAGIAEFADVNRCAAVITDHRRIF